MLIGLCVVCVFFLGCMCYEFTWTSGAGEGKSMVVQAINAGGQFRYVLLTLRS